jgi:hypothetical protein
MIRRSLCLVVLAAALAAVPAWAQSDSVGVDEMGAVAMWFAYGPEKPEVGGVVKFYAYFKGTPLPGTVVTWSFPEGKAVGNPVTVVFESGGYKRVEVEAYQPGGKPLTDSQVLEIADPKGEPPAGAAAVFFEVNAKKVVTNEPAPFIASFKGTPVEDASVRWDFGTGEPLYGNPVQFTFPESRKWLVTVTLEQPGFKPISYSAYVVVYQQRVERKWR